MSSAAATNAAFDPRHISRPDPALMRYYLIASLLSGPGFFFAILPLFFKYETLRYRFDDEGISSEIRDLILSRLRHSRTAALGDEVHHPSAAPGWSPEHLAVLREICNLANGTALRIQNPR